MNEPTLVETIKLESCDSYVIFLERMLRHAPVAMGILDDELHFLFANTILEQVISKTSSSPLVGEHIANIVGEQNWQKLRPYYERAKDGETVSAVLLEADPFGSQNGKHFFLTSLYPLKQNNETKAIGIIIHDITKQNESQEISNTYKERLELAQVAGGIGTFEWDLKTNKVWLSDQEMKILGVTPGSYDGNLSSFGNAGSDEERESVFEEIMRCAVSHEDYDSEFRIKPSEDDAYRWIKGKGKFFYDEQDKPVRMIGINYDITQQKMLDHLLEFKAEASKILSVSLDYRKTTMKVARLAVEHIADWFAVDIVDDSGNLEQVTIYHKEASKIEWARKLRQEHPLDMNAQTGIPRVMKTGKTEFYPTITDEMIEQTTTSQREKELVRAIGISSIMILPLKIKHKTIGGLTLAMTESKRHFTKQDLNIAEQLASRISMAIENATLYEKVKADEQNLKNLISNVNGIVWEIREKAGSRGKVEFGVTTYVSDFAEKMLGYPLEDWYNTLSFWTTILHPEDKQAAIEKQMSIFKRGTKGVNRYRWITKSGDVRWIESHMSVLKDEEGRSIGLRGVSTDFTARMENEQRKDEFISMASHELKTPLTSMTVFNQVLLKNPTISLDPKATHYLNQMNRQIKRLNGLVVNLLDVTKIQTGKLLLNKTQFSLHTLLSEIIEAMQTTTKDHEIILEDMKKYKLYADRDRIGQVITNLLSNAIKYSPDNGAVKVKVTHDKDFVIIAVKDSGIGISKEHQKRIFDRFYRVFDATDQTYPGLGIGLYISSQIVSKHNGLIQLQSTPGKGSTFKLLLPMK